MSVEMFAAAIATGSPTAMGHIGVPTPFWPGAYFDALPFPDLIMPVARADQGMGNFVEDGVQNLFLTVALNKANRQLDGAVVVHAQP